MTSAAPAGKLLPTLLYPFRAVGIPCAMGFLSTIFFFGFGLATGFVAATPAGLGLLFTGLVGAVLTTWLQPRVLRSRSLRSGRLLVFAVLGAVAVVIAVGYVTYTMISANQSISEVYPLISVIVPPLIVYLVTLAIITRFTVQLASRK